MRTSPFGGPPPCCSAKARYPNLPNSQTTTPKSTQLSNRVKKAIQGWAIYTDARTCVHEGETIAGWGAVALELFLSCLAQMSQQNHISRMQGQNHSNKTALSFLGFHGPVARDSHSCIFYYSKHATSICLGTIQSRANVSLGLTCQRLQLEIQLRLRFTLQHIYSHAQNLGNEYADHAAALARNDPGIIVRQHHTDQKQVGLLKEQYAE